MPGIGQNDMGHAIADPQFAPRIIQHYIEKLQSPSQSPFQRASMQHGMTKQIEAAGAHRPCSQPKEFVVDRFGNQPPQTTIFHISDGFCHCLRQADLRHQGSRIHPPDTHAFERILDEARCNIMAFHGFSILQNRSHINASNVIVCNA